MAKKHWIYIKRGLSEDPKHRAAMGECVWLYMHIIDRADWETGIAYEWKDKQEAADMGMTVDTLRAQRQKLEKLDYIRCKQRQHDQDIYIMEWKNPRDYGAETKNPRFEGVAETLPSTSEGGIQGSSQGGIQVPSPNPTPSLYSKSKSSSLRGGLSEKDFENANQQVTDMIVNAKKVKYQNRDKIPEPYLIFSDLYNELTGQEPTKRVIQEWFMAFEDWKAEKLQLGHIRAAYQYANRPEGGFPVGRPSALTNTAVAMKSKGHKTDEAQEEYNPFASLQRSLEER